MARFIWETPEGDDPAGKSRVYFTCHPEDFEEYYPRIRANLFALQDCALCHTESLLEPLAPEDLTAGLEQMELMVVPVTWILLTETNRATDQDLAFAKERNIPILPIMMEPDLDELYAEPDKFGNRQYLQPDVDDETAVPYGEKLRRFLESVLVGEALSQRIRETFRGYFFLSYRKKDRLYANELMKRIHAYPECMDVAIWYDEFLMPGEDFENGIRQAMDRSGLMVLAVTPNLLEEPDGKPNFVMGVEYPRAREAGKKILPVELVKTHRKLLEEKYPGIEDCLDPEEAPFRGVLQEAMQDQAFAEREDSAERRYLIGLAYLHGIDMETDRNRGVQLLESAAEQDHFEAMDTLANVYFRMDRAAEAADVLEKLLHLHRLLHGPAHPETLDILARLADTLNWTDRSDEVPDLLEELYLTRKETLGPRHEKTLEALEDYAVACYDRDDHRACSLLEQYFGHCCREYGTNDPRSQRIYNMLCDCYYFLVDCDEEAEKWEFRYAIYRNVLGQEHPDTVDAAHDLTSYYVWDRNMGGRVLGLCRWLYQFHLQTEGPDHRKTRGALERWAQACMTEKQWDQALELVHRFMEVQSRVYGSQSDAVQEAREWIEEILEQMKEDAS